MRILALETSTRFGSIALMDEENLLAECSVMITKGHAGFLLPAIDYLLEKIRWNIKDIEAICCAVGPGTFASLRIGLATAKGLAFATGAASVGINTLKALAVPFGFSKRTILAVVDAKKKEVYGAFFQGDGMGNVVRKSEDIAVTPLELAKKIEEGTLLVGEGSILYKSVFEQATKFEVLFAPQFLCYHRAGTIAALGGAMLKDGKEVPGFNPHYIRPPDAVENKSLLKRSEDGHC